MPNQMLRIQYLPYLMLRFQYLFPKIKQKTAKMIKTDALLTCVWLRATMPGITATMIYKAKEK